MQRNARRGSCEGREWSDSECTIWFECTCLMFFSKMRGEGIRMRMPFTSHDTQYAYEHTYADQRDIFPFSSLSKRSCDDNFFQLYVCLYFACVACVAFKSRTHFVCTRIRAVCASTCDHWSCLIGVWLVDSITRAVAREILDKTVNTQTAHTISSRFCDTQMEQHLPKYVRVIWPRYVQ